MRTTAGGEVLGVLVEIKFGFGYVNFEMLIQLPSGNRHFDIQIWCSRENLGMKN